MQDSTIKLPIESLRIDGGTQPREAMDPTAVQDYMEAMQAGLEFPPVTVFYDGVLYWLADGFHRREATIGAGFDAITCDVHKGTQQDAQWYSFSANKSNGLRRSNEDKQRAVQAALVHPCGAGKSDRDIARHVGVDHQTVANWRRKVTPSVEVRQIDTRTVTRNGTTYQQNTANIGKRHSRSTAGPKTPIYIQRFISKSPTSRNSERAPAHILINRTVEVVSAILETFPNDREATLSELIERLQKMREKVKAS